MNSSNMSVDEWKAHAEREFAIAFAIVANPTAVRIEAETRAQGYYALNDKELQNMDGLRNNLLKAAKRVVALGQPWRVNRYNILIVCSLSQDSRSGEVEFPAIEAPIQY